MMWKLSCRGRLSRRLGWRGCWKFWTGALSSWRRSTADSKNISNSAKLSFQDSSSSQIKKFCKFWVKLKIQPKFSPSYETYLKEFIEWSSMTFRPSRCEHSFQIRSHCCLLVCLPICLSNKLFRASQTVLTNTLQAIVSPLGERISLSTPIQPREAKGCVEKWLSELQGQVNNLSSLFVFM